MDIIPQVEPRGSDGTPEQVAISKFKTRVVKARDAYVCCKKGYLRTSLFALQVVDFITEQFFAPPTGPLQASVVLPKVEPWVRVTSTRPMPGTRLQIGFIDLSTSELISTLEGPETKQELQAMTRAVLTITDVSKRTTSDCITCVKKALLGQSKRRKSVQLKKPLGNDSRLVVRVPHR